MVSVASASALQTDQLVIRLTHNFKRCLVHTELLHIYSKVYSTITGAALPLPRYYCSLLLLVSRHFVQPPQLRLLQLTINLLLIQASLIEESLQWLLFCLEAHLSL
jgi:hypothetical protein